MTEEKSKKIEKAFAALRSDESLLDCVLEMIDTVEDKKGCLKSGDDAEDAVVNVIQKTGEILLQKWAEKENRKAEDMGRADPAIRFHEKKRSAGTPL